MTLRESKVLKLLAEGKTNQDIAELLHISRYTVRRRRRNIMRKLGTKSLTKLFQYALSHGYITN